MSSLQTGTAYGKLISLFSFFYRSLLKGVRKRGIPVVLIALICGIYCVSISFLYSPNPVDYRFFMRELATPLFLPVIFGFGIDFEEAKRRIDMVIRYPRVSSRNQEDGTSLDKQNTSLKEEEERVEPDESIVVGNEWESANTMDRKTIREIYHLINNTDKTCCLMVYKIHRLSRADPFEACVFLYALKQNDVILYVDDMGYLDLESLEEQMMVMLKLTTSKEEYDNIDESTDKGIKSIKEDGGYPFQAPFGYSKKDEGSDHKLYIDSEEAEIIRRGAELITEGDEENGIEPGNVKATKRQLDEEFAATPSYNTLLKIYRTRLYTGDLIHDGETVGECPAILTQETFHALREIIDDREQTTNEETGQLDSALKQVVHEFGVGASLEMFEDIIKGKCPNCGDDVQEWGGAERWGKSVECYRCVNHPELNSDINDEDGDEEIECEDGGEEEQVCRFEGPLLTGEFLREWQKSIPITCPVCQQPLCDDDWQKSPTKINAIEQRCDNCGTEVSIDLPENKFERGIELPEFAINFFNNEKSKNESGRDTNEETGGKSETTTDDSEKGEDDNHRDFSEFL